MAEMAQVRRKFGKVLPVRLPHEVAEGLRRIARTAGITRSDALRLAIRHGLPSLPAGRLPANHQETTSAPFTTP